MRVRSRQVVSFTLPEMLVLELDKVARILNTNRSRLVEQILAEWLQNFRKKYSPSQPIQKDWLLEKIKNLSDPTGWTPI